MAWEEFYLVFTWYDKMSRRVGIYEYYFYVYYKCTHHAKSYKSVMLQLTPDCFLWKYIKVLGSGSCWMLWLRNKLICNHCYKVTFLFVSVSCKSAWKNGSSTLSSAIWNRFKYTMKHTLCIHNHICFIVKTKLLYAYSQSAAANHARITINEQWHYVKSGK